MCACISVCLCVLKHTVLHPTAQSPWGNRSSIYWYKSPICSACSFSMNWRSLCVSGAKTPKTNHQTRQTPPKKKTATTIATKTTTIKTRTKLEPNILPSFRITTLPHIHHSVVIFFSVAGRFKFTVWLAQRKTWTHSKKWFQFGPMTSTKCLCMSYHRHWFRWNRKIFSVSYIYPSHWW